MNQRIEPLLEVEVAEAVATGTPDPEVTALPKGRQFSAA